MPNKTLQDALHEAAKMLGGKIRQSLQLLFRNQAKNMGFILLIFEKRGHLCTMHTDITDRAGLSAIMREMADKIAEGARPNNGETNG